MDPFVVFDCAKVLPNRFALVLAAAARSQALHRGAQPRSDKETNSAIDLALNEIAAGAFTPAELERLPLERKMQPISSPASGEKLCGSALAEDAAATVPTPGDGSSILQLTG
jgi:DNA-directed RNA polymerase subunit omega